MRSTLTRLSKLGLFLFLGVLFFSSCGSANHHYYATDEGNLLALREKKDLKVSAGVTPHLNSLPGNNFDVQAGYSPIKHLGIQASYFRMRNSFKGPEDIRKNVYENMFSAAVGGYFFKPAKETVYYMDDTEADNDYVAPAGKGLLFDGYVGYSRGSVDNHFFEETGRIELDFQKFYLQGGVHIFLDKIGASFSLRYANLAYLNSSKATGKLSTAELGKIMKVEDNSPFNFLESALKISLGKPQAPFRAYLTIAGVYDFGDAFLEVQPSTMQIGVVADIQHFLKK